MNSNLLTTLLLYMKVLHNISPNNVYYVCDIESGIITCYYNQKKIAALIKDKTYNIFYVEYDINIFKPNYFN